MATELPLHPNAYGRQARRILEETPGMRDAVTDGGLRHDRHRRAAYAEVEIDRWRDWARRVKDHLLGDLAGYLERAEERLEALGCRVHWAEDADDVARVLGRVIEDHDVRSAVKGKSMLSEEVGVNPFLEDRGVEVHETDLGEFVVQLLEEPPSHLLAPAVHRSLDDIRALFHERLGTPPDADPEVLAGAARDALRERFLAADLGITGGNFLVAETGTLALIENEGNIRLATSLPRVHVALVGIEKLLPRLSDLGPFLQLASRGATGQRVGNYVSLLNGPAPGGGGHAAAGGGPDAAGIRDDGPEELHVILVDAGRSELLADPEAWETLRCIRCAACVNACPVYRQTGGHAYGWMYSGPIGAILAPGLLGLEEAHELPHASSLCGECAEVCPVRIPIPDLLVRWRERGVEAGHTPSSGGGGRALHRGYAAVMTRPWLYRAGARLFRLVRSERTAGRLPLMADWAEHRAPPEPSERSFRELWEEGIR